MTKLKSVRPVNGLAALLLIVEQLSCLFNWRDNPE